MTVVVGNQKEPKAQNYTVLFGSSDDEKGLVNIAIVNPEDPSCIIVERHCFLQIKHASVQS